MARWRRARAPERVRGALRWRVRGARGPAMACEAAERILTIRFTAEMWNISQYIAIYGPDILENIGIYWLILRYIRPVDTSPVYSNIFQYMPELIPGRNKSILEYIGVYCDILYAWAIRSDPAMYPNILQSIPVFSSIQQYSAVFSSIRSAGFWRSGAAVLPQTGAQGHDGARGRLRAPDRWLIVRRLDGGRPYAQTDRERLRPECKMGSRRRLRWRMSSRIDALNSASGCHASTANVGIAEPTHLGWPPA